MAKYIVTRNKICAGQLTRKIEILPRVYDSNGKELKKEEYEEQGLRVSASCSLLCRGMLFRVNEDGLAEDLIYSTPTNYPIEGITPTENIEGDFIIDSYVELNNLLKYLKYGSSISQSDLNKIYRRLIKHNWWLKRHKELFDGQELSLGYFGETVTFDKDYYDNLDDVSSLKRGIPHPEEPEYALIKRKK